MGFTICPDFPAISGCLTFQVGIFVRFLQKKKKNAVLTLVRVALAMRLPNGFVSGSGISNERMRDMF